MGFIIPASPSTPSKLNKSLPIRLPIAIPCLFLNAAVKDVANSGAEVPAATMVTAITQSETPNALAREEACSTIRCPPRTIEISPAKNHNYDFKSADSGCVSSIGSFLTNKKMIYPIRAIKRPEPSIAVNVFPPSLALKTKNRA